MLLTLLICAFFYLSVLFFTYPCFFTYLCFLLFASLFSEHITYLDRLPFSACGTAPRCQEIGLVALMFFFELLFPYVSLAISFYVSFTNLFSIILFLIC